MPSNGHRQLHKVCDRYRWKCYYCGAAIACAVCQPHQPLVRMATRDHYQPRSLGGRGGPNLVASCWRCNHEKANFPPGAERVKTPRAERGCQFGRTSASRRKRPHKPFTSQVLAQAMADCVLATHMVKLIPWECPGCGAWHLNEPHRVALLLGVGM